METIPEKSNGILENLIAGIFFFSPNFLLGIPLFRDSLVWVILLYNYVIIFTLISVMSHFRFNIRYTKGKDLKTRSQAGKMIGEMAKTYGQITKKKKKKQK